MSGKCCSCNKHTRRLTRHHVLPQRHFEHSKDGDITLPACRKCHSKLEKLIPQRKVNIRFYFYVLIVFGINKDLIYALIGEKRVKRLCGFLPDVEECRLYWVEIKKFGAKRKLRIRKRDFRGGYRR